MALMKILVTSCVRLPVRKRALCFYEMYFFDCWSVKPIYHYLKKYLWMYVPLKKIFPLLINNL